MKITPSKSSRICVLPKCTQHILQTDYMLAYKTSLNKLKTPDIIPSVF